MATDEYSTLPNTVTRRTALASLAALATTSTVTVLPAAAASSNDVSPKLSALIAAHEAAWAAEDDAVNEQDAVWCEQNGVPCTQEAVDRWHDAVHASDRALRAVIHFRCKTGADRRVKAEYLMQRVGKFGTGTLGLDEDWGMLALLRSIREEGRAGA